MDNSNADCVTNKMFQKLDGKNIKVSGIFPGVMYKRRPA